MNKQQAIAVLGLVGAAALGIGIIVYTTSSPSRRTVTIATAAVKRRAMVDEDAAKAAFEGQVEKYRAAGEPVRAGDLAPPAVEPEKNGAISLAEASSILDKYETAHSKSEFFNLDVTPALPADKWKLVDDLLAGDFVPVLAKVDEATTRPAYVWNVKYVSPLIQTLLPHLNGVRGLANLVQTAALSAHRGGRDDESLRRTAQLLQISRAVDQQPFIVTHLVALGISRLASNTAGDIVPTLKIGTNPGDASEAQVRALIADFLDDAWAQDAFRSSMLAERLSIMDTATCLATNKLTVSALAKMIYGKPREPAVEMTPGEAYLDALPMMQFLDPMIEAAKTAQRLGQFQAKQPPAPPPPPSILGALMPSFDRLPVTHFTALSRQRQAATALAARLWMTDHGGQPPTELSDLVSKYLAAIPLDPLSSTDGGTLTYKLSPQPMIVGVNVRPQDRMQMRLTGK